MAREPSLADQREQVDRLSSALSVGGPLADLDTASLGGRDGSPQHLNLLTLHSAKGCEYDVVIMAGLDLGSLPWRNERPAARRESRRLFYVGLTRARDEIHMLYSGFVDTPRGRMRWGRSQPNSSQTRAVTAKPCATGWQNAEPRPSSHRARTARSNTIMTRPSKFVA